LQAEPGVAVARIAFADLDRGGDQQALDFGHRRDQFRALPVVERVQDRRRGVIGALIERREFAAPKASSECWTCWRTRPGVFWPILKPRYQGS
ncbi:MAG TPA: hypothetical protein VF104_01250, partial [Burkholderiales bacterium]